MDTLTSVYDKIREIENNCNSKQFPLLQPRLEALKKLARFMETEVRNLRERPEDCSTSNLAHLSMIYHKALQLPGILAIIRKISFTDTKGSQGAAHIDIISNYGTCWWKVSARDPEHILQRVQLYINGFTDIGSPEEGSEKGIGNLYCNIPDLFVVTKELVEASKYRESHYKNPQVCCFLSRGAYPAVIDYLKQLGATVYGELLLPCVPHHISTEIVNEHNFSPVDGFPFQPVVNLDVTTLIALVSDISYINVEDHPEYRQEPLRFQLSQEREIRLLTILNEILAQAAQITVAKPAWQKFHYILETLGGEEEKRRANDFSDVFKDKLSIVDTLIDSLEQVFVLGHSMQATTLTANKKLLHKGWSVWIHPPRSLCESWRKTLMAADNKSCSK